MARVDADVIAKYESLMRREPFSKAFAPLADAYLQNEQADRAEAVVRDGLRKNPDFPPGLIVYAKILKHRGQLQGALDLLKKAAKLAPDNILAIQLQGDVALELKKPQEALRAYKSVLLQNPMARKARSMIQKLESLSAIEFEENTFALAKLTDLKQMKQSVPIEEEAVIGTPAEIAQSQQRALQRMLSLIDAFISRNDLLRASDLIEESKREFGSTPELSRRAQVVMSRGFSSQMTEPSVERPTPLAPLPSREKRIAQAKLQKLQLLLRKIDDLRI